MDIKRFIERTKGPKPLFGQMQAWWRTASSWELLQRLFPWNESPRNLPVVASRESFSLSDLFGGVNVLSMIPTPLLVLAGALYVAALILSRSPGAPICLNGLLLVIPLAVLVPSLLLWALPLALALAPLVARERQAQTWEILRATPYTCEEILLSRAQVALVSLRKALRPLWHVQLHVLIAVLIGGGGMVMLSGGLLTMADEGKLIQNNLLCFGVILVAALAIAAFVADRIQQFVLMAVAAIAASTATRSVRSATTAAIGAVLVACGVDLAIGVVVLLAQPPGEVYDLTFSLLTMVLLGPPMGYLMELPPLMIVALIGGTLVVRAIAIRVLWRAALRHAERI